jgi:hypothetical protein
MIAIECGRTEVALYLVRLIGADRHSGYSVLMLRSQVRFLLAPPVHPAFAWVGSAGG